MTTRAQAEARMEIWFRWLDKVWERGGFSMASAGPMLAGEFGMERGIARDFVSRWMVTFDEDKTVEERASLAISLE